MYRLRRVRKKVSVKLHNPRRSGEVSGKEKTAVYHQSG